MGLMSLPEPEMEGITPPIFIEIRGEVVERLRYVAIVGVMLLIAGDLGVDIVKLSSVFARRHSALGHVGNVRIISTNESSEADQDDW